MAGRPKGTPKSGGRKAGTPNRATRDIRDWSQRVLSDPIYQRNLRARMREGSAGPLEVLLYHYAFGKPSGEGAVPIEHVGDILRTLVIAYGEVFLQVVELDDAQERKIAWLHAVDAKVIRRVRPLLSGVDVPDQGPEPLLPQIVAPTTPSVEPEVLEL